jgi:hypothetical protein
MKIVSISDNILTYTITNKHGVYTCIADESDMDFLLGLNQSIHHMGYVYLWNYEGSKKEIGLHAILNNTPIGMYTDHINFNRRDNRRSNLRSATNGQNMMNRGKQANNTSGYKGVTWSKSANKWVAQLHHNGRHLHLGCFGSREEAAAAYDMAAIKLYQDFAHLNFSRTNYPDVMHNDIDLESKLQQNNTSGYKGVTKVRGRYRAIKNRVHLGYFDTAEQAAMAYETALLVDLPLN